MLSVQVGVISLLPRVCHQPAETQSHKGAASAFCSSGQSLASQPLVLASKGRKDGQEVLSALLLSCPISYAEKVPEKQFIPSPAHIISRQSWQEPQREPIQVWLAKPRGEAVVNISMWNKPSFKLLIHCGSLRIPFLPWSTLPYLPGK